MTIVSDRLKELRATIGLSQTKLGQLANCTQAKINRYENGNTEPPFPVLMWYADYFDVSLDYIFGRTDNPKGTTFEAIPKYTEENKDFQKFIEMCFDPTSPMHKRLKETMLNMAKEEE
ncbi:MAG: helix-turn-helix transcriptional regulator [Eubacteriales bacterium]